MVETDNALKYSELQDAACRELGLGADASAKSGNDLTLLNKMVREGFDMASNPPHLPGEALTDPTHQWRWIHPWTTMLIWPALAADDDVTAAGSDKVTVSGHLETSLVELTGGATFHPSMVRQTIHFVTADVDFTICRYISTSKVRVAGDCTAISGETFTIASGQFGMPDDFAGIESPLSEFQPTRSRRPIQITGQHQIRRERNILINRLGFPHMVAFIPRYDVAQLTLDTDGTDGGGTDEYDLVQRWDMVTTPYPNEDYTLEFKYRFRLLQLSSTNPYPPGGPHFGRLVMTATLARSELERFKVEGPRWSDFYRNLASAIAEDLRAVREEYIGPMWRGDDSGDGRNLHHSDTSLVVTVNDVVP